MGAPPVVRLSWLEAPERSGSSGAARPLAALEVLALGLVRQRRLELARKSGPPAEEGLHARLGLLGEEGVRRDQRRLHRLELVAQRLSVMNHGSNACTAEALSPSQDASTRGSTLFTNGSSTSTSRSAPPSAAAAADAERDAREWKESSSLTAAREPVNH